MLFASFDFLLFLLPVFIAYWALEGRPRARAAVLVAAGYFFYMAAPKPVDGPPPPRYYYVGLLIGTTLVDFLCGRWIAAAPPGSYRRRALLALSLSANLGLLGYFKYAGFLLEVASDVSRAVGSPLLVPAFSTVLPIGISFYTFQSLSYTVDVYRGRISAEPSLLRFASFITFFPQLVAGPIVRASQFLPQLYERPQLTRQDVDFALYRILKGVVKKVVFADFIAASFTDRVLASPAEFTALENWVALYAFTLQIYADFSGYSDVAIGTARLFGFRIPENFNRPYQALDVADFWRRWHMTLSTWLRDYVYYPLGGSRKGAGRTYANLWLTMFLVGLWHGATVNFVIYAVLQASAMVFNRFTRSPPQSNAGRLLWLPLAALGPGLLVLGLARILELPNPALLGVLSAALGFLIAIVPSADRAPVFGPLHVLLTLHFSVLSRTFFRANSLSDAKTLLSKFVELDGLTLRRGLFANEPLRAFLERTPSLAFAKPLAEYAVLLLLLLGFLLHYFPAAWLERKSAGAFVRTPGVLVGAGIAVVIGLLGVLLAGPRPNIYFAF
jgi:alginate O-acetyltransferase complex protein AlgI